MTADRPEPAEVAAAPADDSQPAPTATASSGSGNAESLENLKLETFDSLDFDRALVLGARAWETSRGQLTLLCVPALRDHYVRHLQALATVLGHPFGSAELRQLRGLLGKRLKEGFEASPYSQLVVRYATAPPPQKGLAWDFKVAVTTPEERGRNFLKQRPPERHGRYPDAMAIAAAERLGPPETAPVLDIGAGTGRNAIALAQRGHPVEATDANPVMAEAIARMANRLGVSPTVRVQDALNPLVTLPGDRYGLILLSGVVAYFRSPKQLTELVRKVVPALRPGGLLLFDAFRAVGSYEPTSLARQLSRTMDAFIFTEAEIDAAIAGAPLRLVADEDAFAYECDRLSPEARRDRVWSDDWATGRRLFVLPEGLEPPVSLRWLLYERT